MSPCKFVSSSSDMLHSAHQRHTRFSKGQPVGNDLHNGRLNYHVPTQNGALLVAINWKRWHQFLTRRRLTS